MATFEVVDLGYTLTVAGPRGVGGCVGFALAPLGEVFPPLGLTVVLDQVAPQATSTGSFVLSGSVTGTDPVLDSTLTVNGVVYALELDVAGDFSVVVEGLVVGYNTLVVAAEDVDETASASLVVAYQPPAQLRDVLVLDTLADVVERLPWHLRSTRR